MHGTLVAALAWGLMRRFDLAATSAAPSTCDGDDTASSFDANVTASLGDRLVVGGLNAWGDAVDAQRLDGWHPQQWSPDS